MKIEVTDSPDVEEVDYIARGTRNYNSPYVNDDYATLCVFCRDDSGSICGGLTGKTYWDYLDIGFLWVREDLRKNGLGSSILSEAEGEAIKRGCNYALLDTYSFQALPFYQSNGFQVFGEIDGFCGKHTRYYLRKLLVSSTP